MTEQAQHPSSSSPAKRPIGWLSHFLLLSFGYVAARFVLGLVRTRLLTEVLPKELYGSLTLAAMTVTFAASFLSLGGYEFLVRRLPGMPAEEQRAWLRLLLRRLAAPGWLLAGVVMGAGKVLGLFSGVTWLDGVLLWCALVVSSWLFYRTFYFLGCGCLVRVRLMQLFQHDLWFFAIAGAAMAGAAYFTALVGVWLAWLTVLVVVVTLLTGTVRGSGRPAGTVGDAVSFGLPLLPMIAGDILFRIADRYLLLGYQNMSVVAEYTLCMNIAMIAYTVGASLMDLKIPALYAARNAASGASGGGPTEEMRAIFTVMLRLVLGAGIPASLALVFFSRDILRLLSGPAFHEAAPLLPWTAPVPVLFLVVAVWSRGLLAMDRSRLVGGMTLAAALVSGGLSFLLIPGGGAPGAASAISISLLALVVGLGWQLRWTHWMAWSAVRPWSLFLLTVMCVAGFAGIREWLPMEEPWWRLSAGGLWALVALAGSRTYAMSDFRTPSRQTAAA